MSFRRATMEDAELLYLYRLTQEQQPWYQGETSSFETHHAWLEQRLTGPARVMIWQPGNKANGMVRLESDGHLAHHGDDPMMLHAAKAFRSLYGGRLKATLDPEDPRGDQLAEAGFTDYEARTLIYKEET